jgi:hypothetical protein
VLRADISSVLVGTLTLVACEGSEVSAPIVVRDEHIVADGIARVGDRPIGAADVALRMEAEDLNAEEALERLIDEELLVQEARRRGITEGHDDERALERIMVRAMLHDLEADLTPEAVPDEEVREDFEAQREKLELPERRKSWHILVKDTSEAGRRLAESIEAEVHAANDPRSVFRRYAEGGNAETPPEVRAEDLPPITRRAGIEQPYKDALFAAESTGPLDSLVETSYGLHVIVLAEILPSERRTLKDVEGEIRARLSQKKRFERLAKLVQAGEAEGLVEYDEKGVARLLEMPGLPERRR